MSGYGEVLILRDEEGTPVVVKAGSPALMSVELLREMAVVHFIAPDVLYLGNDESGAAVHYRIHGWEPQERALIIYREVIE